jgi:hypothetical protein
MPRNGATLSLRNETTAEVLILHVPDYLLVVRHRINGHVTAAAGERATGKSNRIGEKD